MAYDAEDEELWLIAHTCTQTQPYVKRIWAYNMWAFSTRDEKWREIKNKFIREALKKGNGMYDMVWAAGRLLLLSRDHESLMYDCNNASRTLKPKKIESPNYMREFPKMFSCSSGTFVFVWMLAQECYSYPTFFRYDWYYDGQQWKRPHASR